MRVQVLSERTQSMTRIYSAPDETEKPRINRDAVSHFFDERAKKAASLGPTRAVIYQDKHPDLAERRDAVEKAIVLPLLNLDATKHVLDVGCGTGRWTGAIIGAGAYYHGIDASAQLLSLARQQYPENDRLRFTVASLDSFTLKSIGEERPFHRILCAGVMMYLNDDELLKGLDCIANALAGGGRAVLREPMGIDKRLTICEHYSTDMDQIYNAIYRTEAEISSMIHAATRHAGIRVTDRGDVYDDSLNNRADTRQRWLLLERPS